MADGNGGWKLYLLGIFAAISLALSGVAYQSVITRVEALEQDKRELTTAAQTYAVNAATLNAQMESIKESVKSIDASQQETAKKVDTILILWNKNSKTWEQALEKWAEKNNIK